MKRNLTIGCALSLLLSLGTRQVMAQCAPSALNVASANLIVNTYYPGTTANVGVGAVSIALGTSQGANTGITKGDLLLIIQMQGSTINSNNGLDYGDGVAGGPASGLLSSVAGNYEYAVAANSVGTTGGTLYLTRGTKNSYVNAAFTATAGAYRYQVVRVPRYTTVGFGGGSSITASAWDGTSGGVVAFDASGAMSVTGTFITVSSKGFRGGAGRQLGGTTGFANTDVRTVATSNGAKGEGIAGTPRYVVTSGTTTVIDAGAVTLPNGTNGNGAPGNAGGGGTDGAAGTNGFDNSGGGGGGNGGAGGRGGKSWSSNLAIGGYGGVAPSFLNSSRLILGGGGGAGSSNDGTGGAPAGIASSGGAGGGLVLVRVGSVTGTGTIAADGVNGRTPDNDGAGGGGAGGTVYLTATTTAGLSNITVRAVGGTGGNAWATRADNGTLDDGDPEHGPGAGGGGGVVYTNGTINAASTVAGGVNGTTLTNTQAYGATAGSIGTINQSATALSTPASAPCDGDDDKDGIPDANENASGTDPYADADSDGVPNVYDTTPGSGISATDANGDGILDVYDTDGDGVLNSQDLDSDNDGIPDIREAGGADTNNDGVADNLTDTDGDGLVDIYDPTCDAGIGTCLGYTAGTALPRPDSDGDGIPNFRDLDSDNDGITDLVEAGGIDTDGDGRVDGGIADTDGDGWMNTYDQSTGGAAMPYLDTDGDGIPNRIDLDSDNDGIPDVVEAGGIDANNDGRIDGFADADGDGLAQSVDADANNDGTAEATANALIITSTVGGTPGRPASYLRANADGSGLPNPYDLDSDGDGIVDTREAGILQDTNNDGVVRSGDTGWADANGDGWADNVDAMNLLNPVNTDGDARPNYLDIDSDNDGIVDNVEGQTTAAYIAPSGNDADGDGIDNAYDNNTAAFAGNANNGIISVDTDGDGIVDPRDVDSDNDGKPDRLEGWDTNGNGRIDGAEKAFVGTTDTDGDGLLDEYDVVNGILTANNSTNSNATPASYPDVNNPGGDRDWRQLQDWDKDGVADIIDQDDDNDGIPDSVECPGCTSDPFTNGSFELPVFGGSAANTSTSVPGWSTTAADNTIEIWSNSFNGVPPYQGTQFAEINANQAATLYQNFCLNGYGATVLWRARHRGRAGVDVATVGIGNSVATLIPQATLSDNNNAWGSYNGVYTVPAGVTSLFIGFTATSTATGDVTIGNFIDDIQVTIINQPCDSDGDGIPDAQDLDSDGDGIPDLVEAGGIDTNGDGKVDNTTDTDGDGLSNTYDTDNGGVAIANLDTDGDGIPNAKDLDSDNDGIPDVVEAGGADTNNDGKLDATIDTDGDGLADAVDGDADNNGAAENTAGALIITSTVGGTPGRPASYPRANQDGNGLSNPYDLDSDGDGILDSREAGITLDTNNDGVITSADAGWADANGDGWADNVDALATLPQINTDGRGRPNYLDIDSDDDGIVDNVEGQTTAGYIAPSGNDTDGDGIDNAYDNNTAAFAGNANNGITPTNSDNIDLPDYLDLDSDNDGYPDSFEAHDTDGDNLPDVGSVALNGVAGGLTDADGDGLLDGYDNNTSASDPTNGGFAPSAYPNLDGGTSERDWREVANTDNVGGGNTTDVDDDNDGVTDAAECGGFDPLGDADGDGIRNYLDPTPGTGMPPFVDANGDGINDAYDSDGDGIINSLDLDSDNDGIADLVEAGGVDTNGDGRVDNTADTDGDGLANVYDTDNGGVNIPNLDTDGDGIPNSRDLDSDGDGIPDVVEAGGTDANNDGKLDGYTDADGDGLAQSVDGDANNDGTAENTAGALIITGVDANADGRPDTYPRANTDRTGLPNPYDLDSDGDGILDARESGLNQDTNNDGVVKAGDAGYVDANNDGWADAIDALSSLSLPNTDSRGPANYLDIDSDDDGLTDNVEGQTTSGYILPTGVDTDGDGIDNAYDNASTFGGNANNGITPNNHDGTDNPDYMDSDSDNDGKTDLQEGTGNISATLTNTTDTDGDGLIDQFDTFNLNVQTSNLQNNVTLVNFGAGGSQTGPSPAGSNITAVQTNGASGNRDWRNSLQVLPVQLTIFNGTCQAGVAVLNWTSADETNFSHYVLERSVNSVDFITVANVQAKGAAVNQYSHNDNLSTVTVSKVYYRLKLVDKDGKFAYSKIVTLNLPKEDVVSLTVLGNPVKASLTVVVEANRGGKADLAVTDNSGKTVVLKQVSVAAGKTTVDLDGSNMLANGTYAISMTLNGKTITTRAIVQR